jgi:hypothetical protein
MKPVMRPSIKRVGKIAGWTIAGCLLVAGIALWTQRNTLRDGWQKWKQDYQAESLKKALKTEVSQLPPVDEVEVYRFSGEPASPGQKPFRRSHYGDMLLYEAKKVILKGSDALAQAKLWRSQSVFSNGVGCHEPHHALRFLNHGKQVSLVIICFQCENVEIPCTFLGGELAEFDTRQPQYTALKKRVEELVGAAP